MPLHLNARQGLRQRNWTCGLYVHYALLLSCRCWTWQHIVWDTHFSSKKWAGNIMQFLYNWWIVMTPGPYLTVCLTYEKLTNLHNKIVFSKSDFLHIWEGEEKRKEEFLQPDVFYRIFVIEQMSKSSPLSRWKKIFPILHWSRSICGYSEFRTQHKSANLCG